MSDKKVIIIGVVVSVLVIGIGISFAYFTSGVNVSGEGSNVNGETAELIDVEYDAGSEAINLTNAIPGSSDSKNFSVTIIPTENENSVTYAIVLDIASNTFVKCDDTNYNADTNACVRNANEITYHLTSSDGSIDETGDLTAVAGKVTLLTETKTVDSATTFNYTLELTYANTGSDQNHNSGKTFTSNVKVEFAE